MMAVRTRIQPLAQTIKLIADAKLSTAAQQQAIASFAEGAIEEADAKNRLVLGRVPPRTITVDGREGAPLSSVRPEGGSIIVEYELIADVLVWIGDTLRARSPVQSGRYRDAWTLLADGNEIAIGEDVPSAEEYTFVNTVPYSRKIEVGLTESGRPFAIQVPNRIAERTARDAAARFGNMAKISSSFIALEGGYTLKTGGGTHGRRRARAHAGSALTYPAIVVTLKAA